MFIEQPGLIEEIVYKKVIVIRDDLFTIRNDIGTLF